MVISKRIFILLLVIYTFTYSKNINSPLVKV